MKKANGLPGLTYCGNGFFRYEDTNNPRLSGLDVAKRVGKFLEKRVEHIDSNSYQGKVIHVLQFSHLYKKDLERDIYKLKQKFESS